jgi:DNA-directed RNA polymerase subunit K/omega
MRPCVESRFLVPLPSGPFLLVVEGRRTPPYKKEGVLEGLNTGPREPASCFLGPSPLFPMPPPRKAVPPGSDGSLKRKAGSTRHPSTEGTASDSESDADPPRDAAAAPPAEGESEPEGVDEEDDDGAEDDDDDLPGEDGDDDEDEDEDDDEDDDEDGDDEEDEDDEEDGDGDGEGDDVSHGGGPRPKKRSNRIPTGGPSVLTETDPGDHASDFDSTDDEDEPRRPMSLVDLQDRLGDQYLLDQHPESLSATWEEIKVACRILRNDAGVIVDPLHRTSPYVTKYERAAILGKRAVQLAAGVPDEAGHPDGLMDPLLLAQREWDARTIPFILRRFLPNGLSEYWRLSDLGDLGE